MTQDPLKLYVDPRTVSQQMSHVPLLYPFWGVIQRGSAPLMSRAYATHGYDERFFALTDDVREAAYVLLPHPYLMTVNKHRDLLDRAIAAARQAGKPLLIDAPGDLPGPPPPAGSVTMRFWTYRFARPSAEVIVPLPAEDMLETYRGGVFAPRKKQAVPSVGFVGWTKLTPLQRAKTYLKEIPIRLHALLDRRWGTMTKGVLWRSRALRALARTRGIELRSIQRSTFGARTDTADDAARWRKEFVDNLDGCDYALCIKGDANVSYRFYEALALGRIPLYLDTEAVLPLEDLIDYRSFCVFVDHRDVDRIGEKLLEFHATVPPQEFEAMQRRARYAFEKFLRLDSFSPYLAERLKAVAGDIAPQKRL